MGEAHNMYRRSRKPKGWRGESARHSLAARGIPTVARGRRFSSIKTQDDFQEFLGEERSDISRRRIADARFQLSRDRKDLNRLREIDIQILHAMEDNEIDLAEILMDAKYSDRDLHAGGILQSIREKISPKKPYKGPGDPRIDKYYNWFTKELNKRNKKLAKAPNDQVMEDIEGTFDTNVAQKRQSFGLTREDVEEIEATARQFMTLYEPSERTLVQREKAGVRPMVMRKTSAQAPPKRITEKFNELSMEKEYSTGESSVLNTEASRRDIMIDTIGVTSPQVQKDVASVMEKDRYKVEREYREELGRNRSLRTAIGKEMDKEWDTREDEINFRERQINEAERALVAGGIVIPSGLLSSLAMGIGGALGDSLGSQPTPPQMSSSGQKTSPTVTQAQAPPPAPTAPSGYLLIKESDIVGTITQSKGGE